MYAIIENGNKQYKVSEGDVVRVEKLDAQVGDTVEFKALMVSADDGIKAGADVAGAKVTAKVEAGQVQEDHRLQVQGQDERAQKAGAPPALHRGQDRKDHAVKRFGRIRGCGCKAKRKQEDK